jgi:hypothetical protein
VTLQWALLAGRLAVAVVFAVAALAKLADPGGTRASLRAFGVPAWAAGPGGWALPLIELAVAGLLVPAETARVGAVAALALLVVFSAVLVRELARGEDVRCNCFGALSAPSASRALARNAVLAGTMTAVAVEGPGRAFSAPVAAAAVVIAALAWIAWGVLRQHRLAEPALTVEHPGDRRRERPKLPLEPGDPAPRFALPDAHGAWHTLDDLLVSGRPLVIAFSDPDCAACDGLTGRLAAWQAARAGKLAAALVTRASQKDEGFEPLLTQSAHEVAHLYGAWHVPSALLVAPDGRVASPLAVGESAIELLLRPDSERR